MIGYIILSLFVIILSWTTFNLTRKVERLETWIEEYAQRVIDTQKTLKEIDNKGNFEADDEVTIYVHLSSFYDAFYDIGVNNLTPEYVQDTSIDSENEFDIATETPTVFETQYNQVQPKSGDVFVLTEYGKGRPGNRSGKQWEGTEILDEDIAKTNPLGGHYVWIIKGKRFDYSFEPGLSAENGSQQVFDNAYNGILSGGTQTSSSGKKYNEQDAANNPLLSINDVSREIIFDMPNNDNTNVYGTY